MSQDNGNGNKGNCNSIGTKVIPHNELAPKEPQMSINDFTLMLSELQDEAYAHGLEEVAMLLHRALGKMTMCQLKSDLAKRMEKKLGNDAAYMTH